LRSGKKGRFELVTKEGDEYYLHLHENIKGMISQDGKATPVSAKTYPLGQKDFAKIQIQDVSFFLNFTPAPPKLKTYRLFERDPLFLKIWILSLVLTVFTIFSLSVIPVNPTIEIEQLPERLATIIYEPRFLSIEKPKAPPQQQIMEIAKPIPKVETPKVIKIEPKPVTSPAPPKPVIAEKPKQQTKTSQAKASAPKPPPKTSPKLAEKKHSSGQEGQGQKAKGPEGSRGQPKDPPANTPQLKAQRPGEAPKSASTGGSQTGRSEVKDLGVVDVFKSQEGTLSKLLAGGKEVTQAANKLEGYSGFTSQGEGGLGEAGAKEGGGGQSLGLGGLSDKGVGGGKKGAGLGALGSGGQILGGKGKLIIEGGGLPEPIVLGAIDTDAIAREIAKHRDEIKYCYEKEINAENPNLAGRVGIRFVIGASGAVSASGVSSSSLKNTNVEQCVVEVIRRIQFPPVRGGGIAEVTYPFLFKPATK
jgi:TonB family protein